MAPKTKDTTDDAYYQGFEAGEAGKDHSNPHPAGTPEHEAWDVGYADGVEA